MGKVTERITNAKFAQTDKPFADACRRVARLTDREFPATARQAGKWRRKIGIAWKMKNGGLNGKEHA